MNKNSSANAFACHRQVEHIGHCIFSLVRHGTPLHRMFVVNNASRREPRHFPQTTALGVGHYNTRYLSCSIVWNQGMRAMQAEWAITVNDAVLVRANWIDVLRFATIRKGVVVFSPTLIEGQLWCDFDAFSDEARPSVRSAARCGASRAGCFAAHRLAWLETGFCQQLSKFLGCEVGNLALCNHQLPQQQRRQRERIKLNRIARLRRLRREVRAAKGMSMQGRHDVPTLVRDGVTHATMTASFRRSFVERGGWCPEGALRLVGAGADGPLG